MSKPLIKICGIRNADFAAKIVTAGVNWVGLVFHPDSPRCVELDEASKISAAVKEAGGIPVAVFCNHNEIEMQTICEITKIEMVQLHGVTAKAAHHFLPDYYRRIYVLNISENSELMSDQGIQYLDCQRDFILIDHQNPGQGKLINRKNWRYSLSFSWFVAGGLTAKNVTMMLAELQPNGVDVSSGVEIVRGEKDFSLIQEFINVVRGFHET